MASLSANVTLTGMRADPLLREAFLVPDGGRWRPPRVNETCCRRPQLAALLRSGVVHIAQELGFAAFLLSASATHSILPCIVAKLASCRMKSDGTVQSTACSCGEWRRRDAQRRARGADGSRDSGCR